jgi:hypothetical protein
MNSLSNQFVEVLNVLSGRIINFLFFPYAAFLATLLSTRLPPNNSGNDYSTRSNDRCYDRCCSFLGLIG